MNVYIYQAALLCEDCGVMTCLALTRAGKAPEHPEDESTYDSNDFPKGSYPDGGGESDIAEHCDHCGEALDNPVIEA